MGNVFQDILCIYSVYDTKGHKLVNWFAWKSSISAFVIFDKIIRYTLIAIQATMLAFLFLSDNRSLNYIYDASKMLVYGLHSFLYWFTHVFHYLIHNTWLSYKSENICHLLIHDLSFNIILIQVTSRVLTIFWEKTVFSFYYQTHSAAGE